MEGGRDVEEIECKTCPYANKEAAFCGFCLRKILRELENERGVKKGGQGKNSGIK